VAKRKILPAFTATLFSRKFIRFRLLPQRIPALSKASIFLEKFFHEIFGTFRTDFEYRFRKTYAHAKYFGEVNFKSTLHSLKSFSGVKTKI
jgi:hypothetical protein